MVATTLDPLFRESDRRTKTPVTEPVPSDTQSVPNGTPTVPDGTLPVLNETPSVPTGTPTVPDETLPVPNGTPPLEELLLAGDVITMSVGDYVRHYRGLFKRSAAYFVTAAHTVVHAKIHLRPWEFDEFCDAVNLDPKSSTFRKIVKIGESFVRLEPVLDKLPNKWTLTYRLAHMEEEKFRPVVDSGRLTPFMTENDLNDILNVAPKTKKPKPDVVLDLSGLGDGEKKQVLEELLALKSRYGFIATGEAIGEASA